MSFRRSTSTVTSSTTIASSLAKYPSENIGKTGSGAAFAKKRPPLANLSNQKLGRQQNRGRSTAPSPPLVPCSNKISKTNNGTVKSVRYATTSSSTIASSYGAATTRHVEKGTMPFKDDASGISEFCVPFKMDERSPSGSDKVSMDEFMSTCDSFNSPEVEYMENDDLPAGHSMECKTLGGFNISGHKKSEDRLGSRLVELDKDATDPQLCAVYACDIYKHLRAAETKKRPSINFMEKVQKDINSSMRFILIDWLVEVAKEYRLISDTLYLTVNSIDRYLSGNHMNRQQLQLLGITCMMIAAKYEEVCVPQVEEYCYITDNTYFREEVLQVESSVLNFLKFEITAPTVKCFFRRFVRAAQGISKVPSLELECMANYIAELSLLEYKMLRRLIISCCRVSFLSKVHFASDSKAMGMSYVQNIYDSTLARYTQYQASELRDCVKALHCLCRDSHSSSLPAIREKYSQHKYKFVAIKLCPETMPHDLFLNLRD